MIQGCYVVIIPSCSPCRVYNLHRTNNYCLLDTFLCIHNFIPILSFEKLVAVKRTECVRYFIIYKLSGQVV